MKRSEGADYAQMLEAAAHGIEAVIQPPLQPLARERWLDLFDLVYKLCTGPPPYPGQLYERLRELLTAHVDRIAARLEQPGDSEELLAMYDKEWNMFQDVLGALRNLLARFNGSYARSHDRRGPAPRARRRWRAGAPPPGQRKVK